MTLTKSRYQIDDRKIVIFGAGKIGRSFIGQLFGMGGYKVVFIDNNPVIVDLLNDRQSYRIIIKGEEEQEIRIQNVSAINSSDLNEVSESVSSAGILAVSVGKNALGKIIPAIAEGLKLRYERNPDYPLDIIIAENLRNANRFLYDGLIKMLPSDYSIDSLVGLIETSIGKMVPVMTPSELDKDPLMIFAEPYNTLILDGKAFKSTIPDIAGLAPKENMKAWVDRKAFIHNLGHATAAYYGFYRNPESVYLYEVMEDSNVLHFTRNVMLQSADILRSVYPGEFTAEDLEDHIDDLILRFRNKALRDTLFRIGHDLTRKLASGDRFIGALNLALQTGKPFDKILKAMSFGFTFSAKDEDGNAFPSDSEFLAAVSKDFESALLKNLGLNKEMDKEIIADLKKQYILNII